MSEGRWVVYVCPEHGRMEASNRCMKDGHAGWCGFCRSEKFRVGHPRQEAQRCKRIDVVPAFRVEALEEALRPFAGVADNFGPAPGDTPLKIEPLTVGDFRRARAALAPPEGEAEHLGPSHFDGPPGPHYDHHPTGESK